MKTVESLSRCLLTPLFVVLLWPVFAFAEEKEMEIRQFFNAYNASFEKGPEFVAEFYDAPCITARMGASNLNVTREDTARFFSPVLEKYRARGWAYGEILSLDHQPLGVNSILATIRWAYKDKDGNTLWEWTFSYNLYKRDDGWKILLQTMHDS